MGAVIRRPFKVYNIESRAMKIIDSTEKTRTSVVPPRHPTQAALEERMKGSRDVDNEKNEALGERLKQIYVESKGDNPVITAQKRKLPESREKVVDPEWGYLEPVSIPAGRLSLRQAVDMIVAHKEDPTTNSQRELAEKYNLELDDVYKILEYFQAFKLRLPSAAEANVVKSANKRLRERKLKQVQKQLDTAQQSTNSWYEGTKKIN